MKALHINAEPKSIGGLLVDRRFVIPEYQRPYSWGVEQCDRLWDDIMSFVDERSGYYFLGSIVIYPQNESERSVTKTWCVIDGQQRLTTLMILIKILLENARTMTVLESDLYLTDPKTGAALSGNLRLETCVHPGAGRDDQQDLQCVLGGQGSFTGPKVLFQ